MLFGDLLPPTLQDSGIFHDSTRSHIHSNGLPPKAIRRLCILLRVRYKYYRKKHSRSGLAWSRPFAERSLSRPTSDKCIPYNNRCVQNFIQIG